MTCPGHTWEPGQATFETTPELRIASGLWRPRIRPLVPDRNLWARRQPAVTRGPHPPNPQISAHDPGACPSAWRGDEQRCPPVAVGAATLGLCCCWPESRTAADGDAGPLLLLTGGGGLGRSGE